MEAIAKTPIWRVPLAELDSASSLAPSNMFISPHLSSPFHNLSCGEQLLLISVHLPRFECELGTMQQDPPFFLPYSHAIMQRGSKTFHEQGIMILKSCQNKYMVIQIH